MGTPWERMHCASLRSALRSPADTPPPPLSCGGTTRCRQALWADRNAGERGAKTDDVEDFVAGLAADEPPCPIGNGRCSERLVGADRTAKYSLS